MIASITLKNTYINFLHQYIIKSLCLIIFSTLLPAVNSQENNNQPSKTSINQYVPVKNNTQAFEQTLVKANTHYQEKNYNAALIQYKKSLEYLKENDTTTQKHIGNIFTKIAESYKRIKNRQKTAEFYKKSLDIFIALDNKKYMARTLNTLAESERYLGNLVIALNYSTQSLKIHNTINDPKGYAKALMGAGIIYRHIGRYEKSLQHIHKAYIYYKEVKDFSGIAKTSNEMGNIYIKLKEFEQAKYFFQETINLPEDKLSKNTFASALRQMAVINLNDKSYKDALFYAKRAYAIYKIENDRLKISLSARIIANVFREQEDYINATNFYKIALAIAIEEKNEEYQIKTQIPLASIMIGANTEQAINLLKDSLAMAINIKDKDQTFYAYRTLRQAEDYNGNYKRALYYAKKEISLAKEIKQESENNKLTLAKAALYSQQKEIELESLREKTKLDQLELVKKNNEIALADQARVINELELRKEQYGSIALASLLFICVILVVFIFRSFVISKKRNKKLYHLASRDHMTNCFNRRTLFKMIENHLLDPYSNNQYCIIMADIDHFKIINDTYGHGKGDSVIKGFAATLQNCIRQNDIVARYGGEEFCIVLHDISCDQALILAENMRKKTEESTFDNISITSSFGVTSLKHGAKKATELIEQADIALYKSKSLGRNQVTLWNNSFSRNIIDN